MGRGAYPNPEVLYITADAGGSNGYRSRVWKHELQHLADETGLTIQVSHFPPGTSKWNKIEHRLFCHITANWRGTPLTTYETVVDRIGNTRTAAGLQVQAELDAGEYPTGVKVTEAQMDAIALVPDAFHGDWNYKLVSLLRNRDRLGFLYPKCHCEGRSAAGTPRLEDGGKPFRNARTAAGELETRGSWSFPPGYEGKRARRDAAHFPHDPFQLTVVRDPLPIQDQFVFGQLQADGLSAGLARPVVVGAMTGVRVVVAATGGPPACYPAGGDGALAYEPERLQLCLEPVVLLLVPTHRRSVGHQFVA